MFQHGVVQHRILREPGCCQQVKAHVQVDGEPVDISRLLKWCWRQHKCSIQCQKGLHCTPLQETVSCVDMGSHNLSFSKRPDDQAREVSPNELDPSVRKARPCCCHVQEQAKPYELLGTSTTRHVQRAQHSLTAIFLSLLSFSLSLSLYLSSLSLLSFSLSHPLLAHQPGLQMLVLLLYWQSTWTSSSNKSLYIYTYVYTYMHIYIYIYAF